MNPIGIYIIIIIEIETKKKPRKEPNQMYLTEFDTKNETTDGLPVHDENIDVEYRDDETVVIILPNDTHLTLTRVDIEELLENLILQREEA